MKRVLMTIAAACFVSAVAMTPALAAPLEGVKVEATRIVEETVGHSSIGAPINEITLSYRVTYADLDLKKKEDVAKLETRVHDAAMSACKEISHLRPNATPDDQTCAKRAFSNAKAQINEAVAAARK